MQRVTIVDGSEVDHESLRIPYIDSKGSERTYIPDFFVRSTCELTEVKPKYALEYYENLVKMAAALTRLDVFGILRSYNQL